MQKKLLIEWDISRKRNFQLNVKTILFLVFIETAAIVFLLTSDFVKYKGNGFLIIILVSFFLAILGTAFARTKHVSIYEDKIFLNQWDIVTKILVDGIKNWAYLKETEVNEPEIIVHEQMPKEPSRIIADFRITRIPLPKNKKIIEKALKFLRDKAGKENPNLRDFYFNCSEKTKKWKPKKKEVFIEDII